MRSIRAKKSIFVFKTFFKIYSGSLERGGRLSYLRKEEDEIDKSEKSIDFMLSQTLSTVMRIVRFELKQKNILTSSSSRMQSDMLLTKTSHQKNTKQRKRPKL